MHEWALAESILTTAIEESKKEKIKKITEIKIAIGELQQIEKNIFKFALDEIIKEQGQILKNVKIIIKTEKSKLKCKNCENSWSFNEIKKEIDEDESESIHFIPETVFVHTRCPKCGSPDFEITTGRRVSITQIKGEK
jgi:hydrogenase nickel incorporation protein HypA/HybF